MCIKWLSAIGKMQCQVIPVSLESDKPFFCTRLFNDVEHFLDRLLGDAE